MSHLGSDRYDVELQAETARFAEAVRDADPARPVPTCPAWTLAQLTAHVGFGHRWAALIVERRATGPAPHDQADDLDVPKGAEQRSRWLRAGARWLADAVREAGPRTGVWSWAELELFRVLPRIDDFPALAGLCGRGQTLHFHATDPGRARQASGWPGARRPASSGSTSTIRATSSSAARSWTCCWC